MDEKLIKEMLDTANKTVEEIKKMLPPPPNNDKEVSPAIAQHLEYQKAQQEKREKEIEKNGFYRGY